MLFVRLFQCLWYTFGHGYVASGYVHILCCKTIVLVYGSMGLQVTEWVSCVVNLEHLISSMLVHVCLSKQLVVDMSRQCIDCVVLNMYSMW